MTPEGPWTPLLEPLAYRTDLQDLLDLFPQTDGERMDTKTKELRLWAHQRASEILLLND